MKNNKEDKLKQGQEKFSEYIKLPIAAYYNELLKGKGVKIEIEENLIKIEIKK